ncbi:MAG: SpoIIE family protein phosphatase, partial [Lachnospiraceae bacterium]|nr:SpoIIE family protein phosphatase [Lachnospiraceae bacterium]
KLLKYVDRNIREDMRELLDDVRSSFGGIENIYILIPEGTGYRIVLEGKERDIEFDPGWQEGNYYEYDSWEREKLLPSIIEKKDGMAVRWDDLWENPSTICHIAVWEPLFAPDGNYIGILLGECIGSYVVGRLNDLVKGMGTFFIICIIVVLILTLLDITRVVVLPLSALNKGVDSYTHGDFELDGSAFKRKDELYKLGVSFQDMAERIEAYTDEVSKVTAERERMETELAVGTKIQTEMLPRDFEEFSKLSGLMVYAYMRPALEVGGDFYDYFQIDDTHYGFVMADVSGKGVPASLEMVVSMTLLHTHLMMKESPKEAIKNVNIQICNNNNIDMFVTVWVGVYDSSNRKLTYVNAGHEYPVVYVSEMQSYYLQDEEHDLVVGIMDSAEYTELEMKLSEGDRLFLYTDGLPEAMNVKGELFGTGRMMDVLNSDTELDSEATIEKMKEAVSAFVEGSKQSDDITMMCLRF